MAKECGYCGAIVAEDSIFCTKCGQRVTSTGLSNYSEQVSNSDSYKKPEQIKEPESIPWNNPYPAGDRNKRLCPGCGRPVEDEFLYCIICGTPVSPIESVENDLVFDTHQVSATSDDQMLTTLCKRDDGPGDYPGDSVFQEYDEDAERIEVQVQDKKDWSLSEKENDSKSPMDLLQIEVPYEPDEPALDSGDEFGSPESASSNKSLPNPENGYESPLKPSESSYRHSPSDYASDSWAYNRGSENDEPGKSSEPNSVRREMTVAVPEEETEGSSLFISSDLLRAMKKRKKRKRKYQWGSEFRQNYSHKEAARKEKNPGEERICRIDCYKRTIIVIFRNIAVDIPEEAYVSKEASLFIKDKNIFMWPGRKTNA